MTVGFWLAPLPTPTGPTEIVSWPMLRTSLRFHAMLSADVHCNRPTRLTVLTLNSRPLLRTLPMFWSWLRHLIQQVVRLPVVEIRGEHDAAVQEPRVHAQVGLVRRLPLEVGIWQRGGRIPRDLAPVEEVGGRLQRGQRPVVADILVARA